MKRFSALGFVVALLLLFSGCSSKQYYTPKQTYSASHAISTLDASLVDLSREGATLGDGRYISKHGIVNIHLGEGFRFLSESDKYVLASNPEGILKIINKQTGKPIRSVVLHIPIVSAYIDRGVVVYVLNNNTYGVYKVDTNTKLLENRSERSYAIDTRAATPVFIDNLAVIPMFDGKIIVLDVREPTNVKAVYLSSEPYFNNVIYLKEYKGSVFAATAKKLIRLGAGFKREYNANISEVAVSSEGVYVFTKEGEIIRLDFDLKPIKRRKFKFAHFSAATVFGGRVYALDKQGHLIVLSANLQRYRVYEVGEVERSAFIYGTKLYKDNKVINLPKLNYDH